VDFSFSEEQAMLQRSAADFAARLRAETRQSEKGGVSAGLRQAYDDLGMAFADWPESANGAGLAVLGVYGVLAYAVRLQRREIGIRLALGARVSDVVGGVVRRGLQLIVVGAVLGSAAALATTRLMTSLLFGVGPRDPVVFAVAAAALAAVATAACVLPARAAATVDPVDALRQP
jgi:hypothetical protein